MRFTQGMDGLLGVAGMMKLIVFVCLIYVYKDNKINGVNCMQFPFHCIMLIVN